MELELLNKICKKIIAVKSNNLFSICSDEPCFYFVKSGKCDLFEIEKNSNKLGRRTFLIGINDSILIPSFSKNNNIEVSINTISDTEICVIDSAQILLELKEKNQIIMGLIENWILKIFNSLNHYDLPSNIISISNKLQNKIPSGVSFIPNNFNKLFWLKNRNSDFNLFGNVEIDKDLEYLPFARDAWYKCKNDFEIELIDFGNFNLNDVFIQNIFQINAFLINLFKVFNQNYLEKNLNYIKSSTNFKVKEYTDSLNELKNIIPGEKNTGSIEDDPFTSKLNLEDIYFKTCQEIGNYEKIDFIKPKLKLNKNLNELQNILKASNIRSRKVNLNSNWWNDNHGAMLGYLKDSNLPVALIPKGNSSYQMIDFNSKKTVVIDQTICNNLIEYAFCFYTPLPKKELGGKDLINYAMKFIWKDIASFFLIGFVSAALALLLPITNGYLFNQVIPDESKNELLQISILLLTIVITIAILNFARSIAILRAQGKASYKIQAAIWDRILSIDVGFFKKYSPGDLAQRSMGIEQIKESLSNIIINALVAGIFSIFYLILLFYYNWVLALFALLLGLIIVAFTVIVSFFAYKHIVSMKRMEAIISGFMLQILRGINKIRVTDSKDNVFSLWSKKFAKQKESYVAKRGLLVWAAVFTSIFPIFGTMVIFIKVHSLYMAGNFSIGDFIAFNTAFGCFQGALLQLSMATVPFITIKPTYQMITPLLTAELESDDKQSPGEISGSLEIHDLMFRYNDQQDFVLKKVTMKIEPGQFIALVGNSGSGKSTLMRILLGFEQYSSGSVFFDGKELKDLNIRELREQYGVVMQNSKIMQGTILYNIIGSQNLPEESAWKAARMAGCEDDIKSMPMGMHTVLPAGGGTLSGGQQQRIVIARALVRNPKIFIFDEATSALDNETQNVVSESISNIHATRIVIAHRLSTIINADKIFVLENGVIIEEGNFQELMDNNGFFANLAKRQIA